MGFSAAKNAQKLHRGATCYTLVIGAVLVRGTQFQYISGNAMESMDIILVCCSQGTLKHNHRYAIVLIVIAKIIIR